MVTNTSQFDGDGIFAAVSVLSKNADVGEDRCYQAIKTAIYEDARLGIMRETKLDILTEAILRAQELIEGGFF